MAHKPGAPVRLVKDDITPESLTDEEKEVIFQFRATDSKERDAVLKLLGYFFDRYMSKHKARMLGLLSVIMGGTD